MFILQLIFLIYLILLFYNLIESKKFNETSNINFIKYDKEIIINNLKNLNPFIVDLTNDISFHKLINKNKSYMIIDNNNIISLKSFVDDENLYIYKNKKMFHDFDLKKEMTLDINDLPNSNLFFPINYSLSLFRGKTFIPLQLASHDYNIIGHLEGDSVIHLFNPKHKNEIINKDNDEIKKWGNKITMKKNNILFIPNNWYYIQEINEECVQFHIDIDNYFSFIPNFLK
tara:strand:- start:174 stop:860 length:687 start_codon:yes stop_codon:yes gene_type:complete